MITPRFELTQDDNTLTITVRAPYCSLKELDVQVDDDTFLFYCTPYHLRLNLPGKIEENNNTHSEFNSDSGEFKFTYDKANRGEAFANLEFITKFLCPKLEVQEEGGQRKIEVLASSTPTPEAIIESEEQYGFAQRGGYNFNFISSEFYDIFELNPHEVKIEDRPQIREENEDKSFSFDHYLADYIECDEIDELVHEKSPWALGIKESNKFKSDELDFLKDLPNIQYELSSRQQNYAFTSLLDILYAYCYDRRTTWFEGSCESGWTILKLCATFNTFSAFETPKDAFVSGFRRSLTFPLYRNFNLSTKVLADVKDVLKLGECQLVKILIELHRIFLGGDSARYILNHLFIKDYIIYVQKWDRAKWAAIVEDVLKLEISKEDLGLDLEKLEEMSREEDDDTEEEDEDTDDEDTEEEDVAGKPKESKVKTKTVKKVEDNLTKKLMGLSLDKTKTGKDPKVLDSDDDAEPATSEDSDSDSDDTLTNTESD